MNGVISLERPSVELPTKNRGNCDPTWALATIGKRGENTVISQLRLMRYEVHRALKVSKWGGGGMRTMLKVRGTRRRNT